MARQKDKTPPIRDVIAIDGEGIQAPYEGAPQPYTLLMAACFRGERPGETEDEQRKIIANDSWDGNRYVLEDWDNGLATSRIFRFLTGQGRNAIAKPRDYLACAFFFDYDVTMWIRDFTNEEKAMLWESGNVFWHDAETDTWYYVKYMPHKIFFVGVCTDEVLHDVANGRMPKTYSWPTWRSITIFDVSGFAQTSFVKAIRGWVDDSLVEKIVAGKERRGEFTKADAAFITEYCGLELLALNAYVRKLQKTFLDEGISLGSWHGGGALADHFLKTNRVNFYVKDPDPQETPHAPLIQSAIMHAYFGGRSEVFRQGMLANVHNYDINSAYPAASVYLPHLVGSRWEVRTDYTTEPYALWHVKWDVTRLRDGRARLGPFPFRLKHEVYFPSRGEGIYHACEVASALAAYGPDTIVVQGGIACLPASRYRPLGFVEELAQKRVAYKTSDAKRAIPYKYGLNSLYGKFAQAHASTEHFARYQSYYAAGFITAMTRAQLLRFTFQADRDGSDIIAYMTDGILCLDDTRTRMIGPNLGQFQYEGAVPSMILIEPGVWYEAESEEAAARRRAIEESNPYVDMKERARAKTRGLAKASIGYQDVYREWLANGNGGSISFEEQRFRSLGYCYGMASGNPSSDWWDKCGVWEKEERSLSFKPHKKFFTPFGVAQTYTLIPTAMNAGETSEPYVPKDPSNPALALALYQNQMELADHYAQPDWSDECL